ncbi:MAG: hypothetical protein JWR63_1325 [Conexibacter sp.]|nr:hypothetical protein [Conexibacter sp.]
MTTPLSILQEFLDGAFDPDRIADVTERLVAEDATYVSLNFDDPDLRRLMPWAGTKQGRQAFIGNFLGVAAQWWLEGFEVTDTLVDGDRVALFGSFTLRSRTLGQAATSPMVVFAKVTDGHINYFQYMEDTFATARTFRSGGTWTIQADPSAPEPIEV